MGRSRESARKAGTGSGCRTYLRHRSPPREARGSLLEQRQGQCLDTSRSQATIRLYGTGLEPLFPLWRLPTADLAYDMIRGGVKAKITCVDPKQLDRSYAGRNFDAGFVADLPTFVDPCGENGEFHTFVFDAPVFSNPIQVESGGITERDGFISVDLL